MSMEPLPVSHSAFDEVCRAIVKTYPKACVCFVDCVRNPALERAYEEYVDGLRAAAGSNPTEAYGWHGTRAGAVRSIVSGGFDPGRSTTAAYGLGTYVARDAVYSSAYARQPDEDEVSYTNVRS